MADSGPLHAAVTWPGVSDFAFTPDIDYTFVTGAAARHFQLATDATTTSILGVVITDPDSGEQGTVQFTGLTKVRAGGSVTLWDVITTNGSGRATACTSGDVALGVALDAATADGELIAILLTGPGGRHPGVV
jgi:hypothetical protein